MPNKWIEHVKEYAKKHNISYACALSHPDLKKNINQLLKKLINKEEKKKRKLYLIN